LAAYLLGASARQAGTIGGNPYDHGPYLAVRHGYQAATRGRLGADRYEAESRRGLDTPLDDAVRYAVGDNDTSVHRPQHHVGRPDTARGDLTPREFEVADLIALGLTNRQVAARLVISQRTAESHVEHIMTKLGLTSRTQLVRWRLQESQLAGAEW
jgi:non-specific serine/threonine protein kinase